MAAVMIGRSRRLFVPGPVEPLKVPQVVAHEQEPWFAEIVAEVVKGVRQVFGARQGRVLLTSMSGTAALECAIRNLTSSGARVIVGSNGHFGDRIIDICKRVGLTVEAVRAAPGCDLDLDGLLRLSRNGLRADLAICVHCESSTGVVNDIQAFADAVSPIPTLVDAVSSCGAVEILASESGFDAVVTTGGKALMASPGLAITWVSERGLEIASGDTCAGFHEDWSRGATESAYDGLMPWTPPTPAIVQLHGALSWLQRSGGVALSFDVHAAAGQVLRASLPALGLRLVTPPDPKNCVLTAVRVPTVSFEGELIRRIRDSWGFELGPGLLAEPTVRIGHLGAIDLLDVLGLIFALGDTLKSLSGSADVDGALACASAQLEYARSCGLTSTRSLIGSIHQAGPEVADAVV